MSFKLILIQNLQLYSSARINAINTKGKVDDKLKAIAVLFLFFDLTLFTSIVNTQ